MNEALTVQTVVMFFLFGSAVLGIWWRIEKRIERAEKASADIDAVHAREIADMQREFSDYRLTAARDFASVAHMKDVEVRLTGSIDRLTNRIEALPREFAEQVARILTAQAQQERRP